MVYRRSEDILSAGHKLLFELVKFGEMPLFERGSGREAIVDGESGLMDLGLPMSPHNQSNGSILSDNDVVQQWLV